MFSWNYRNIYVILGHKSIKLMDDDMKFAGLVGMVLGLADFNNYEFRLKSGSVKRVFEDNKHYEVLLEYYDGTVCYAKETDIYTLDKIIRTYKEENPESFAAYMKHSDEWFAKVN